MKKETGQYKYRPGAKKIVYVNTALATKMDIDHPFEL
jgi:hypothetical protein